MLIFNNNIDFLFWDVKQFDFDMISEIFKTEFLLTLMDLF